MNNKDNKTKTKVLSGEETFTLYQISEDADKGMGSKSEYLADISCEHFISYGIVKQLCISNFLKQDKVLMDPRR